VSARKMTCEKCSEVLSLNQSSTSAQPLNNLRHMGMPLILPTPGRAAAFGLDMNKFCGEHMRYGQPLETHVTLYKQLGLPEGVEEGDKLKSSGEQAIVDEFHSRARDLGDSAPGDGPDGKSGWTDLEWLQYLTAPPVASKQSRGGEDEDSGAKALADKISRLRAEARERGLDVDRNDSSLEYWMKRPVITAAGLTRGHVLALRLFASGVFRRINAPLLNGCSKDRPHPYPATVIQLSDALSRLRNAQVEQRRNAIQKAATLAEEARKARDTDDEELALKAATVAKDAAAAANALKVDVFWRGVHGLSPVEFKLRGATEVGFFTMSKNREVAQQQALSVVQDDMRAKQVECKYVGDDDDDFGENDEERVYLTLSQGTSSSPTIPQKRLDPSEVPILLFKLQPTETAVPCDLTFLSPTPSAAECVYPPGVYLEQRKETMEYVRFEEAGLKGGGDLQAKLAECQVHFSRAAAMKGPKKAVEADAKAAEAVKEPPNPPAKK